MPDRKTAATAAHAKRQGKAPSTQAGAFVKKEIDRVKHKEHGVKSTRQAIAIGLSEARRAGVNLKAPKKETTSTATRKKATRDGEVGAARKHDKKVASSNTESHAKRSRATTAALKRESSTPVSGKALSSQGHKAASRRSAADRSAAAKKGAQTKGASGRSAAAKKAARTRTAPQARH